MQTSVWQYCRLFSYGFLITIIQPKTDITRIHFPKTEKQKAKRGARGNRAPLRDVF